MAPKNRTKRSNRVSDAVRAQIRFQSKIERGYAIKKLNTDPPPVKLVPWTNITIVNRTTGGTTVTKSIIATWLRNQLELPDEFQIGNFRMRMRSIKVWADNEYNANSSSVGAPLALRLRPFSIIGEEDMDDLLDFAENNRYAAVGYVWPRAMQRVTFVTTSSFADDHIYTVGLSNNQAPWIGHTSISFSFVTQNVLSDNFTLVQNQISSLSSSMSNLDV